MKSVGVLAAVLRFLWDFVRRRERLIIRAGTHERMLAAFSESGTSVYSRSGVIRIYNVGPGRVTVNSAGWVARDGTAFEAEMPMTGRTLEPGMAELAATRSVHRLLEAHERHGGLTGMYVTLAGQDKPLRAGLPPTWIDDVRGLAARERRH